MSKLEWTRAEAFAYVVSVILFMGIVVGAIFAFGCVITQVSPIPSEGNVTESNAKESVEWERLGPTLYRTKTPTGWLVKVTNATNISITHIRFVEDVNHTWLTGDR